MNSTVLVFRFMQKVQHLIEASYRCLAFFWEGEGEGEGPQGCFEACIEVIKYSKTNILNFIGSFTNPKIGWIIIIYIQYGVTWSHMLDNYVVS